MLRRKRPQYKQTAFDTAVRNPERYKEILDVLINFENIVLNDANLLIIVSALYKEGVVTSGGLDVSILSDEELNEEVIKINNTRKADGGFPAGYASRFWTYARTLCELGFVYAQYNQEFKISNIAKLLINKEIDEQEAFSIQTMKYNRRSPYRNVLNDFNFFRFILELLLYLRSKNRSLSYEQFILATFSEDGNVEKFLEIINNNTFPNYESVYNFVLANYKNGDYTCTNPKTVTIEYPDVVRRVFIISGFISIKYQGIKLIQINENKLDYIKDLLEINHSLSEDAKVNPRIYFQELEQKDNEYLAIINKYKNTDEIVPEIYINKLQTLIDEHRITEEIIINSLKNISHNIIEEFREIPAPLKLEFFISLLIVLKYGTTLKVKPNYKADHLGKPYSHAPRNIGDIEVFTSTVYWLIEVTLIRNKIQQLNHETTSCIRHLVSNERFNSYTHKYLSFVAPYIHEDTRTFYDYQLLFHKPSSKELFIKTYSIEEFIDITLTASNLQDMQDYTNEFIKKIKKEL